MSKRKKKIKRTYEYKSIARPIFNRKGHYTGWMKAAGTQRPIKKTEAEILKENFFKKSMDGSRVSSMEFPEY